MASVFPLDAVCNDLVALARQIAVYQGHPTETDGLQLPEALEERLDYQLGRWKREERDKKDRVDLASRLGKLLYYVAQIRLREPERGQQLIEEIILAHAAEHGIDQDEVSVAALTVMRRRARGPQNKNPGVEKNQVRAALTALQRERSGGTARIDVTDVPAETLALLEEWRIQQGQHSTTRAFVRALLIEMAEAYQRTRSHEQTMQKRIVALSDAENRRLIEQMFQMLNQPEKKENEDGTD